MGNCLNCGERIYKNNRTGYCSRTRACARFGEVVSRPVAGVGSGNYKRPGAQRCLNCPTVTATWHGYCTKTAECRNLGYASLRYAVFVAYGGACCACCGEARLEHLSLDHVDGDGHKEGRKLKGGGARAKYAALRSQGFPSPEKYQVLCHNCNMEKGTGEACYCRHPSVTLKLAAQGSSLFSEEEQSEARKIDAEWEECPEMY